MGRHDPPGSTIIDGDVAGSVVTFQGGETQDTRIDGFTIQKGHVSDAGGGIYCSGADASPLITSNLIAGNSSQFICGGITCFPANAVIENNEITGNYCSGDGGGIYCGTSATITNNIISENATSSVSGSTGGGIYCRITSSESPPVIINNTIHGNFSYTGGGIGVWNSSPSPVLITNSIIWDNAAYNAPGISWSGSLTVSYTDIQNGYSGTGNIDADPLFTTGPQGYHYLMQNAAGQPWDSPCVDAGDPGSLMITGTTRTDEVQDAGECRVGTAHHKMGKCP